MAPRTRAQAHDDPIDSMDDTSIKKTDPPRKRTRKDPSKKSEEFDTPLPSVEDEQSAPTFTQISANGPIGARTRSRSASVNLTTTRTQEPSRSITPATKGARANTAKRGKKRKQDEENDDEDNTLVKSNKKSRGNDHSDDTDEDVQPTRAAPKVRGGRGRGRGGRGRGGKAVGSLHPIEESPAKDLTSILSAHPTQTTPSRVESTVDAPAPPSPSPFASLQLHPGSGLFMAGPSELHSGSGLFMKGPSDTEVDPMPYTLTTVGGNNTLKGHDGPSPSHAAMLESLKRPASKKTGFASYPTRQASPEKEFGYESLSDSEIPDYKAGTAEWRETKVRWKAVEKYVSSGDAKYLAKSNQQRKPSNKTSAQRSSMPIPSTTPTLVFPPVNSSLSELRITDVTIIEKLRAVAAWATSDASNQLPTVDEIKGFLEQTKSQVYAPTAPVISHSEQERPGNSFTVPDTPTDESDTDTVIPDHINEDAHADDASMTQNNTVPLTPHRPTTPEPESPQGWFGSAKKRLQSTFSFSFTSTQKLPAAAAPSQYGGRRAPQTERPHRFNPKIIPPENLVPGSERRSTERGPLHMRGAVNSPDEQRTEEMVSTQEKQRREQRQIQEASVADEDHKQRKGDYYLDYDELSEIDIGEVSVSDSEETSTTQPCVVEQKNKIYEGPFPPAPMRDWENDDRYGFTFTDIYSTDRFPILTHLPPNPARGRPMVMAVNPSQPWFLSKRAKEWRDEREEWEKLCRKIIGYVNFFGEHKATQADVDKYTAWIKEREVDRAAEDMEDAEAATASSSYGPFGAPTSRSASAAAALCSATVEPPPAPKFTPKELPSKLAKANPYAPKTPSRLRNAERAYSSSPVVFEDEEDIELSNFKADEQILKEVANRKEILSDGYLMFMRPKSRSYKAPEDIRMSNWMLYV